MGVPLRSVDRTNVGDPQICVAISMAPTSVGIDIPAGAVVGIMYADVPDITTGISKFDHVSVALDVQKV